MSTSETGEAPVIERTGGACPRCGLPLHASATVCTRCHLVLGGPLVAELNDLNQRHQTLRARRTDMLAAIERDLGLIDRRRAEVLAALDPDAALSAQPQASTPGLHQPADTARPAADATATLPARVNGLGTQALLLSLGVLCLAIAAAVFAAVGWGRLNEGGQAAVLLTATIAAGLGGSVLYRRGLRSTGEAVLGLAGLMVLVDTAMFGAALGAGTGDLRFWSGGLVVLAALGAASRKWGGTASVPAPLTGGLIAVVAAQLVVPLAIAAALGEQTSTGFDLTLWEPRPTQLSIAGVAVVAIVQALLCSLAARERRWSFSSPIGAVAMLMASGMWLVAASMAAALTAPTAQAAVLAGAAIAAALAASLPQFNPSESSPTGFDATLPINAASAGSAATGLGAWAALAPSGLSLTVWLAIGAGAVLIIARTAPNRARWGAVVVGAAALTGASWVLTGAAIHAIDQFDMFMANTPGAGGGVADFSWVDVLVVGALVTTAAVCAPLLASGRSLAAIARRTWIARSAAGLVAFGGFLTFVLPALLGTTQVIWAVALAAVAAAGAGLAVSCRHDPAARVVGWLAAAAAVTFSLPLAHVSTPLALLEWWALAMATAGLAFAAGSTDHTTEASTLAGVASLATIGAATATATLLGADPTWIAGTAALTAGLLATAAGATQNQAVPTEAAPDGPAGDPNPGQPVVPLPRWLATACQPVLPLALGAQAIAIAVAVAASLDDGAAAAGTITLLIGAVTWFVVAAFTRRAAAAAIGAVLTQLASWLLLGLADVTVVEAYTLPGALVLLAVGAERMRRSAEVGSWNALGAALGFGLVPSSLIALTEGGARTLAAIGVASLIVTIGAVLRLGAPVVLGAACVLGLSLVEVSPVIGSLPRYITFGAAGALLLLTGATFERRRAELAAAHRHLRALR